MSASPTASSRRFCVGGNWKCNGTKQSVTDLVNKLNALDVPKNVDVVIAPTFVHLDLVQRLLTNRSIEISAQNCHQFKNGAYTGEVSAEMLRDLSVPWVILGHSERRHVFKTDDETVGKQISQALSSGLKVIACIGETLEEREANKTMEVCVKQMKQIVANVNDWSRVVIAYEPVWAIGTGKTATPAQAQEVHASLRQWLASNVNASVASSVRIIYGGSVKGSNAEELARQTDIDGFLVGGASLKAGEFATICMAPNKAKAAKL